MSNSVDKKAVLVLGMHRSGTSAITAALSALGVQLGSIGDYANEENPKGFFENQDIVKFNDRMLKQLGYSWSNPFVGRIDERVQELDCFFNDAVELLKKSYGRYFLWGLKDPRICLLLPFWKKVISQGLGCKVLYVHILRNPLEVAESLKVRSDRFSQFQCGDIHQSLLLWFRYYFQSLVSVDHDENILIPFDGLLENPRKQLSRLTSFLDIKPDQKLITKYVDSFLENGLKHHSVSMGTLRSRYHDFAFVADLHENLVELQEYSSFDRDDIKEIISKIPDLWGLQACSSVAAPIFQNSASVNELQQSVSSLTLSLSKFEENDKQLHQRNLEIEEKDSQLHQRNLEIEEKNSQLHQRNLEIKEKNSQLHQRNLEIKEKDRQLHQRNLEIEEKDSQLHQRNLEIEKKNNQLRRQLSKDM